MKKKIAVLSIVFFILVLLLAGCSKKDDLSSKNVIRVGVAQDFDSLDPHHMQAAGTKEILFNVFEGLVKPTPDGDIIPAVASEVKKSAGGLEYVFTLRDGVKFHNGEPVTMDDVLYSFIRRMDGVDSLALLPALSVVESMDARGNTLTIRLSQPSNEFLSTVMNVYIIPKDYEKTETQPVGTGPFRFVSRAVQDYLELERFDDYWGKKAGVDGVVFRILESPEALVLALQSGAVDLAAHLSSDQVRQLPEKDFDVATGSMNLVQALYLNNAVEPFDNVLVRQALCHAVDKKTLIDLTFDGYGIPLGTSMFPSFAKYYVDELTDYYPHDVEKAKRLLAQAGYPDGFSMTITVPGNYTPHVDTAVTLVEMLREAGIEAEIVLVDWATWLDQVYSKRNFQSTVTGVSSDNMTARKLLERFGSSAGNNFTNYSNADYDRILAKAISEPDDVIQTGLYRELEKMLTETAANVYIQDMADLVALKKNIKGLVFYPIYVLDVSLLYIE